MVIMMMQNVIYAFIPENVTLISIYTLGIKQDAVSITHVVLQRQVLTNFLLISWVH